MAFKHRIYQALTLGFVFTTSISYANVEEYDLTYSNNPQENANSVIVRLKENYSFTTFSNKLNKATSTSANGSAAAPLKNNLTIKQHFNVKTTNNINNTTASTSTSPIRNQEVVVIKSNSLTISEIMYEINQIEGVDLVEEDHYINLNLPTTPNNNSAIFSGGYSASTTSTTPNDPDFSKLWGLGNSNKHGVNAPAAWSLTTGSQDVIVGIIDTGVNYQHSDLNANMWTNTSEANGVAGVDDDGNGYIDDIYGIDTYNNDADPMDDHFHGSHVAGTIGAVGNNANGIVGINWDTKIAACKFLSSGGWGSVSGAIECVNYFNTLKMRGENIVVMNNSWGGVDASEILHDAINTSGKLGIIFTAAAGNDATDIDSTLAYPASYDNNNIISVAATNSSDELAGFSSYGYNNVDIAAPGQTIYSTALNDGYRYASGTSMATPHVTGAIALAAALYPNESIQRRIKRVLYSTDIIDALNNKVLSNGRLNLKKMLTFNKFGSPSDLSAKLVSTSQVQLNWKDNTRTETAFQVYHNDNLIATLPENTTSYTVSNLAPDTTHAFHISAIKNNTFLGSTFKAYVDSIANTAQIPLSERTALLSLYSKTNGNSWTHNDYWGLDYGSECDWYGVECDEKSEHVIGLHLNLNDLAGFIPKNIRNFKKLTTLELAANSLTGQIPDELFNLTTLEKLALSRNKLTGNISNTIGNLKNLTELYIGSNKLTGSIPPEIGNLTNLTVLMIFENPLYGNIPSEIGQLTKLQDFRLINNCLSGSIPSEIGNLTNLVKLTIAAGGNERICAEELTGPIPLEIGNLTNLKYLTIVEDNLNGSIPAEIGNLSNLQLLTLGNNISGVLPETLAGLSSLKFLYLTNNKTSGSIKPITQLKNATIIALSSNEFTGRIPTGIKNLENISYLALDHNRLSGEIPAEIGLLGTLEQIYLNDNLLSGTIPAEITNIASNITSPYINIWLDNNHLTGALPESFQSQTRGYVFNSMVNNYLTADNSFDEWLSQHHRGGTASFRNTQTADYNIPSTPEDIHTIIYENGGSPYAEITWTDTSTNENGFKIFLNNILIGKSEKNTPKLTIYNLSSGMLSVKAYNKYGSSKAVYNYVSSSNEFSHFTCPTPGSALSGDAVIFKWENMNTYEDALEIQTRGTTNYYYPDDTLEVSVDLLPYISGDTVYARINHEGRKTDWYSFYIK